MEDFSFIKPNLVEKFQTDKKSLLEKKTIIVPEVLQKSNLFISILGKEKKAHLSYFSTSLNVQIIENYGQIKVTGQDNRPVSKVSFASSFLSFPPES